MRIVQLSTPMRLYKLHQIVSKEYTKCWDIFIVGVFPVFARVTFLSYVFVYMFAVLMYFLPLPSLIDLEWMPLYISPFNVLPNSTHIFLQLQIFVEKKIEIRQSVCVPFPLLPYVYVPSLANRKGHEVNLGKIQWSQLNIFMFFSSL